MNKKAEQFKAFLEERKINAFQMEEIPDNARNAVVFRSSVGVAGQQLPALVITDDSDFSMLRIQIVPQAVNEANMVELLKMINTQNFRYKPFKLYFDEPGNLILDTCMVVKNNQLDGEEVYRMFNLIINYLDDNYREIMKAVWK